MTLGSHQKTIGTTQSWITPKWLIEKLGPFDLDPCASDPQPWPCARLSFTSGGLEQPWYGNVWLNPPFDRRVVGKWIWKLANHGTGIALIHARVEAAWFEPVWLKGRAILFLADRLYFHRPDGTRAEANSGAPACLIAFGLDARNILCGANIPGYFTESWHPTGRPE